MSFDLRLQDIDRDGALHDALAGAVGETRAQFLRRAVVGGAAAVATFAAPVEARGLSSDVDLINFDLTFELMQVSFYQEALEMGKLGAEATRWARIIGAHEQAHVSIMKDYLGKRAIKKPFFDFQGVTENEKAFTRTAVAMEDLTTALLAGQMERLESPALVSAFFSVITVEARHAAWVRHLEGVLPIAKPLDASKTVPAVAGVIKSTKFMKEDPVTWAQSKPRFAG
jgi:rubrerythrin